MLCQNFKNQGFYLLTHINLLWHFKAYGRDKAGWAKRKFLHFHANVNLPALIVWREVMPMMKKSWPLRFGWRRGWLVPLQQPDRFNKKEVISYDRFVHIPNEGFVLHASTRDTNATDGRIVGLH